MLWASLFLAFHFPGQALGSADGLSHALKVLLIGPAKQSPFVEAGVLDDRITVPSAFLRFWHSAKDSKG